MALIRLLIDFGVKKEAIRRRSSLGSVKRGVEIVEEAECVLWV